MCFFKKRKENKMLGTTQEQNEMIQASLKKIKALKIKLEGQTAVCEALNGIYNKYSNVTANGKPQSINADRAVADILGDIELCVKKSEKINDYSEIDGLIKKIRIALAER